MPQLSQQLQDLNTELARNPYCDLMQFRCTQTSHFVKDETSFVVNKYQKPLSLYYQLLKMFAHPGAVVVDMTMGTGSLEIAAMEADAPKGLEFISFEKNSYQFQHARRRLEKACTKPTDAGAVEVDVQEEELMTSLAAEKA